MVLGKAFKVIRMTSFKHKASVVHSCVAVTGKNIYICCRAVPEVGCDVFFCLIKLKAVVEDNKVR